MFFKHRKVFNSKRSVQQFTVVIIAALILGCGVDSVFFNNRQDGHVPNIFVRDASAANVDRTIANNKTASSVPVRIVIPKIKVDAAVESVGLTREGLMEVPKGLLNAAWFNLGVYPGEVGSAVIDGHYGWWKNGKPAVFNNLGKLRKGDKIYTKDVNGVTTTFIIREVRTYGPKDGSRGVFYSNDGKAHLNLVTCAGVWNRISKNYSNWLIVFADKE